MLYHRIFATLSLLSVALAWNSPTYSGYTRAWQANFVGTKGNKPNPANWNIIENSVNYNNEVQTYTANKENIQFSGAGALQLIPKGSNTAGWTSARIESKYIITPTAGKITRIESSLRLAGNAVSHKQGIWPAFWMLGESYREGGIWPATGEIDIFENVNGQAIGHATVHCDVYPNGLCNEPTGLTNSTPLPDNQFHVWRVEINRKSNNFKQQTITWFMDGKQFHQVTGTQIDDADVWASLAQSPLYIILNVAVGGNWPGSPTTSTWGGTGSMMEVGYVAHYVSQ